VSGPRDVEILLSGGKVHVGTRAEPAKVVTGRIAVLTAWLPNGSYRTIREAAHIWLQLKGPLTDDEDAGHGDRATGDVGGEGESLLGVLGPPDPGDDAPR
jgi:hypothetical protein